jgi:Cof subfamily protein (haloacid dehalogenase superfamily)
VTHDNHQPGNRSAIQLFLSDVDGSLLTPDHRVTDRARGAIERLKRNGIEFTLVSSRPPKGLRSLISELGLTLPISAFNGGMIIRPDLTVIQERLLDGRTAASVIAAVEAQGADAWLYRGTDWFIKEGVTAHVAHEAASVGFEPKVVRELDTKGDAVKIMAVTDHPDLMARCEESVRSLFQKAVSAQLSQSCYLDITHPKANKGEVVRSLSHLLSIPAECFATLGDMANDISMFKVSGLSIAMGNASQEVKDAAKFETRRNDDEGFAYSVESILLPRSLRARRMQDSA